MRSFSEAEWGEVQVRLAQTPKITLEDFRAWLDIEESQAQLDAKFGEDAWSLLQALELMLQPAGKRRARRASDGLTRNQRRQLDREDQQSRDSQRERSELDHLDEPPAPALSGEDQAATPLESAGPSAWAGVPQDEFDRRVQDRLKEYSQWYKDIAPNDAALLKNLCYVETSIAILNALLAAEFARPEPDSAVINRYSQSLKGLNEQALSMQRNLHIDRATREREAAKLSQVDEALAEIEAAGEYVEEHAYPLIHEPCVTPAAIGESRFLFGYLVWDFPEIEFAVTWTCPRCGRETHLIHTPNADDQKAVEPAWVHGEEQEFIAREDRVKAEEEKSVR